MSAPIADFAGLDPIVSLALAFVLGLAFGILLERAGMGDPRKLGAQFSLEDLAVFKTLFSALVTAMLGLFWFDRLGWLHLPLVFVPPTSLLAQSIGGLIFGVGFAVSRLCPGTSCVALASGRSDGAATLAGLLVGIFAIGSLSRWWPGLNDPSAWTTATLASASGLGEGWIVAIVVALALAGFVAAERIERRRPSRSENAA